MTDATAPESAGDGGSHADTGDPQTTFLPPTAAHLGLAAALVAMGDLALFDVTPGAAAGLFAAALLISMAALNPLLVKPLAGGLIFMALLAGCLAIVEEPSFLAALLGVAGLAALAVVNSTHIAGDASRWFRQAASFLPQVLLRLPVDMISVPRWAKGKRWSKALTSASWTWFVPLSMSLLFLMLFATANPILARWLGEIGRMDFGLPQTAQVGFWIVLAFFIWAFLRGPGIGGGAPAQTEIGGGPSDAELVTAAIRNGLLSPAAVCRSLLLFNAVFALQNALDIQYLWGHEALPDGVTYADYAHAGTYPLGASALLAAGFVLLAFPTRLRGRGSRTASALMYLWMAQTVFLVASAMLRMGLYIDAYALTYLRILGLAVMSLIAVGLVLIALRIALSRSNVWLMNANALVLAAALYTACFVNFDGVIADYNVANCREMGGNGVPLDADYLAALGPAALPALKRFETAPATMGSPKAWQVRKATGELEGELQRRQSDWRMWTFRGYRLQRQIEAN
ncbi:MAG: DUF4173 domain-containing protein [Alphaproteobacteria bacterium]|nr:DUF4173 domain-containing protein [Alphaproteobacteria bacterium]